MLSNHGLALAPTALSPLGRRCGSRQKRGDLPEAAGEVGTSSQGRWAFRRPHEDAPPLTHGAEPTSTKALLVQGARTGVPTVCLQCLGVTRPASPLLDYSVTSAFQGLSYAMFGFVIPFNVVGEKISHHWP